MAGLIQSDAQLAEVLAKMKVQGEGMPTKAIAEVQAEVRDYRRRKAEANNDVMARPEQGGEPGRAGQDPRGQLMGSLPDMAVEVLDRTAKIMSEFGQGVISGIKDLGVGIQQATLEGLSRQSLPGAAESLQELELDRSARKARDESRVRRGRETQAGGLTIDQGLGVPFQAGEILGAVAPEIAVTLGTRKIGSGIKRMISDAAAGAVSGAAQFTEEDESRASNALIGLAFGAGGGALGGASTSSRNFLVRDFTRGSLLKETEEIVVIAERMGLKGDSGLLVSQSTRSPLIASTEARLDIGAASLRDKRFAAQNNVIVKDYTSRAEALMGKDVSVATVGKNMSSAIETHIEKLRGVRRRRWENNMGFAFVGSGGKRVIDPKGTELAATALRTDLAGTPGLRNSADLNGLDDFIADLQEEISRGGMTTDRFQDMVVAMTQQIGSPTGLFKDLAKAQRVHIEQTLKNAMLSDLEVAVKAGVPGAESLSKARIGYALDSQVIDELRGDAIERLFGRAFGKSVDEGTLSEKILRLKPAEAKALIKAMDAADPLVSDQMRGAIFADLVERYRLVEGQVPGNFDVHGFLQELGRGKGKASLIDVLYPGDKELSDGFKVLARVTFGQIPATPGRGITETVREGAVTFGSAASGASNVGFWLRLLAGVGTDRQLERILLAPDALKQIRKLAKPGKVDLAAQVTIDVFSELSRIATEYDAIDKARAEREKSEGVDTFVQHQQAGLMNSAVL